MREGSNRPPQHPPTGHHLPPPTASQAGLCLCGQIAGLQLVILLLTRSCLPFSPAGSAPAEVTGDILSLPWSPPPSEGEPGPTEAGRAQDTQALALLSLIALAAAWASWRRGDMPAAGPLHQLLSLLGAGERGWRHPPGSCRIHSFGSSLNCLPRGDTSPGLVTLSLPSDPWALSRFTSLQSTSPFFQTVLI